MKTKNSPEGSARPIPLCRPRTFCRHEVAAPSTSSRHPGADLWPQAHGAPPLLPSKSLTHRKGVRHTQTKRQRERKKCTYVMVIPYHCASKMHWKPYSANNLNAYKSLMSKGNHFLAYLEKSPILVDANDFSTSDMPWKVRSSLSLIHKDKLISYFR